MRTKGPWEWRKDDDVFYLDPGIMIVDYRDGTPWGDEIDQANARLIAAAPDILEALENSIAVLEVEYITENKLEYAPVMETARAAIKKAKGE